jgi:hypothetical protein
VRSGTGAEAELFFEDLVPGRRFDLGVVTVDGAEMLAFAERYDPQWYHVDATLAETSEYGGLIASGFYTGSPGPPRTPRQGWRSCGGWPRCEPAICWWCGSMYSISGRPPRSRTSAP